MKKIVGKNFKKIYFLKKNFCKKNIFEKKFVTIFFQKNIFFKKNVRKNFSKNILRIFLFPTLVEVSSSGLKLEKNEIFLLQWIEVDSSEFKWVEVG